MFLFKKKKDESPARSSPPQPKPDAPAAPAAHVDAEDFFKEMERQSRAKRVYSDLAAPEVTGLRESPLAPPGSTIKNINIDSRAAENLRDKTVDGDNFMHGDIAAISTAALDIDAALARRSREERDAEDAKAAAARSQKQFDPLDADSFFKDMGIKPKALRVEENILVPEIVGLREAPPPPPGSTINTIVSDEKAAEALVDKTTAPETFVRGDIRVVDISAINTDILDR